MDGKLRLAALFLLLVSSAYGQMLQTITNDVKHGTPASNIAIVQSATCASTVSGTAFSCSLSATGTGNFLSVVETDYSGAAAPIVPTASSGTFVTDKTQTGTVGRVTYFSICNAPSGLTSVTIHQASGHSSAVVTEWSGVATSSCFDNSSASALQVATSTSWVGFTGGTTSNLNGLALGDSYNLSNNTDNFTVGTGWTVVPACNNPGNHCGQPTDGDGNFLEYAVNLQGQTTPLGTINSARTQETSFAFYKSAVL